MSNIRDRVLLYQIHYYYTNIVRLLSGAENRVLFPLSNVLIFANFLYLFVFTRNKTRSIYLPSIRAMLKTKKTECCARRRHPGVRKNGTRCRSIPREGWEGGSRSFLSHLRNPGDKLTKWPATFGYISSRERARAIENNVRGGFCVPRVQAFPKRPARRRVAARREGHEPLFTPS